MDRRKVVIVGAGMVGMSYAYALLNQGACDELVLIDIDHARAHGEAMDLNHGLAFSSTPMKISAGDYDDCRDADIVMIAAGVAQKPGESRLDLLQRNVEVFRTILAPVVSSGFQGLFCIATNPVDVMTHVAYTLSGFPAQRVLGSGTALDTARLRYLLGRYFTVDPRNVHAYVMGEHGESEFVPWSQSFLATKPLRDIFVESKGRFSLDDMERISAEVRNAAQEIIQAKKATYYGIGMALVRITRAIFGDENSILTVSTLLKNTHYAHDVFAGVPCILSRSGVRSVISLSLDEQEVIQMDRSCQKIYEAYAALHL